jgi:hypothetical protein
MRHGATHTVLPRSAVNVYLGTHQPNWLARYDVPLFISRRRLSARKSFPRALAPWALDSGAFTELSCHGQWLVKPREYVADVRRFFQEVGNLEWAAIQDWMCEAAILRKTGLSVAKHQQRTVENYDRLLDLAPDVPWIPVLQGWEPGDYMRCVDLYLQRGHALGQLPLVGVGSVCRRQHTAVAELIIRGLSGLGIRLHAFGFKTQGLMRVSDALRSCDSLAWSYQARRLPPMHGCVGHKTCSNCPRYAVGWWAALTFRIENQRLQRMKRLGPSFLYPIEAEIRQ